MSPAIAICEALRGGQNQGDGVYSVLVGVGYDREYRDVLGDVILRFV